MTVEEIIEILVEVHLAEITKEEDDYYYKVNIYDPTHGCRIDMDLTSDELIELYETYFA